MHILGAFCVLISFGALIQNALAGGTKKSNPARKLGAITHGVGLLIILVSGFGMLARLGLQDELPQWVVLKAGIWVTMGAMIAIIYRKPQWARALWFLVVFLGFAAAYLGITKA